MSDPIQMPALPWRSCDFNPVSPSSVARMEGRMTEAVAFGTPYWRAGFSTNFMDPWSYAAFDAFTMKVGVRGTTFIGYDIFRPRPVAHDDGQPLSGGFDGTAELSSITSPGRIVVGGLPGSFQLSAGDYVEIRMSDKVRSLHRITEDATASASGSAAINIAYPLDTENFTTAATVNFEKPGTVMMIDPGSVTAPKSWGNRHASFTATEVFFS